MSTDMILVIGGTGLIGEPVARQLLQDGFHVRVFVRDIKRAQTQLGSDFEYREGDIDAVDALTSALAGCTGVHISLRTEKDDPDLEYRAAARITYVSGGLVYPEYLQGLPDQQAKFRMVSRAFRTPEAANREFCIRGPEAMTISDALHVYCELVEPDKHVTSVPLWFMSIVDSLFMQQRLHNTIQLMRLMQRVGVPGDATATGQVLGVPTTTVRQWCEQQRARRASVSISDAPPD